MEIVEQLAQQAAETINGGEFNDGKWYTEGQRQAWRKALTPAADEIEQLRQQNAELVEALKFYACDCQCLDGCSIADCGDVARKALAKATRGE